jgi:hypothetical protein
MTRKLQTPNSKDQRDLDLQAPASDRSRNGASTADFNTALQRRALAADALIKRLNCLHEWLETLKGASQHSFTKNTLLKRDVNEIDSSAR